MNLYLYINIFTFCTFLFSFDKKVAFYQYFKPLLIAILLTGLLFIPWDILFTKHEIWGFNKEYLLGYYLFKLPIEEWLFFITVPYSCTFIHYVLKTKIQNKIPLKTAMTSWYVLAGIILTIGFLNMSQQYTSIAFILCGISIIAVNYYDPAFMKDYLLTYIFCLIPFFIVNSILTGSFTEKPIVWYNNNHIFGIRLGTIPIEDSIYNMLLLLLICFLTHYFHTLKKASN